MGVCLDMNMVGAPSPPVMEDNTGKRESTQKQVQSPTENASPVRERPNSSKRCRLCTQYS